MNGSFNPIKDLYKTNIYILNKWRNSKKPENAKGPEKFLITENIINKSSIF